MSAPATITVLPWQVTTHEVFPDMDPRLQRMAVLKRQGRQKAPVNSTDLNEVAVIARVSDLAAWEGLGEVRVGATIGKAAKGGTLVTARIPIDRIEAVRTQPFVRSLKPARRLEPTLEATVRETGAGPEAFPEGHLADGGSGVVVGIVDFGCDFVHRNLRREDGNTRLLAIWDQSGAAGPHSPFGYGRVLSRAEIDTALSEHDPYLALGYAPLVDTPFASPGSHGTHVADIAAGNGSGSGTAGLAPRADIVFVQVASSDIPWDGPQAVGKSFGDSVQLLEAIQFIFDEAGERPCVINVSLGTNGGPHDGSSLVEQGIDSLIRQAPNRAVVIAAGNSFADKSHAHGQVPAGGSVDLTWRLASEDQSSNELEIWYSGNARLAVDLVGPDGSIVLQLNPGENKQIKQGSEILLFASSRLQDSNNGDNVIGFFTEQGFPEGLWNLRLRDLGGQPVDFHAWIERDDHGASHFLTFEDSSCTIGSISCGKETVVVASYDAHKSSLPLSFFSSSGPTRDGRKKPEISAPGQDVWAAHSRTETGVTRKSGTSMAAPAVTGILALVLAEASRRNLSLDSGQLRELVIGAARKSPPAGKKWNPRYGMGRISASEAVKAVMKLATDPV